MSNANRATQGGMVFDSEGKSFSWADIEKFNHRYNLLTQTIKNGAVEFGRRCSITQANSNNRYYYGLAIPPGRRLYIWQRTLEVTEGVYEVDLVDSPDGFTGGTQAFKKPLSQGASMSVQTELFCGVTPAGDVETSFQFPLIDTGTAVGAARAGGAADVEGVLKTFTDGNVLIAVRRTTAGAYTSSIGIIAWEEEA